MSISRLSSDVLNQVISFLPPENAHACAGVCKQLNQLAHTKLFARTQIEYLRALAERRADQCPDFPVDDYQKLVRLFANFAAGRCGYSNIDALPGDARQVDFFRLGSFSLSRRDHDREKNVAISLPLKGQIRSLYTIQTWWDGCVNREEIDPEGVSLYLTSELAILVVRQAYSEYEHLGQGIRPDLDALNIRRHGYRGWVVERKNLHWRLDFSLAPEEILFGLADRLSSQPDKDAPNANSHRSCFVNSLNQADKNSIYREMWLINREEGDRHADYGRAAFEVLPEADVGPQHGRRYFVPNKDRAEAILHYSMRLIARRYIAPHGDPLAETMFNRLPVALRNPVYGELYTIKRPSQGEDVWNYGELAFHGRLGTVTNVERRAAILNFVDKGQKVM